MHAPIEFPIRQPLLSLETCAAITGQTNRALTCAVEEGVLLAFDIRTRRARRRALRVYAPSLRDFTHGQPVNAHAWPAALLRAKVADLFPALAHTVSAAHLARVACCDKDHVNGLIADGLLECTEASTINKSARITCVSAVQFLCSRRAGA